MPFPIDSDIIAYMEENNITARFYNVNDDPANPKLMCQFIDKNNDKVLSLSKDEKAPLWGVSGGTRAEAIRNAYNVIKKVGIQREGTVAVPAKEFAALNKEREELLAKLAALQKK